MLEYNSFTDVLAKTKQDGEGIFIPGELMPSGKPVRAGGAELAALRTNKDLAEQWFNAVKGQYEREEEERDQPSGRSDAPRPSSEGRDPYSPEPRRNDETAQNSGKTIEEELQERVESAIKRAENAAHNAKEAHLEAVACEKEVAKLQAALTAVRATSSTTNSSNDGRTDSTPFGEHTEKPPQ